MNDLCRFEPTRYTTAPHQSEGWIAFRESPEKMFVRIADHAALGDWVPLVHEVTVTHPRPLAPGESTIGTTRFITLKGGLEIVEKVVHWNPLYCYADATEGKHFPFKNYVGLLQADWWNRVCYDDGQTLLTQPICGLKISAVIDRP